METSVFLLRQLLQGAGDLDPKVTRHLDKISNEVRRSTSTINELLELARNRPPRRQPSSLKALLDGAVAAAHLPATVQVASTAAPDEMALLDPDQISRVLTNLFINASQAMEGTGQIWVQASRIADGVELRVRDNGPGIAADIRHRIFEALFTTKAKGTGLGLALCQRIVESHGGTIALEPTAAGATFRVMIPDIDERTERP